MLKKKEIDPLDELHSIRKKIYKKTKNMSSAEYIQYIKKEAKKLKLKYKSKKTA